MIQPAERRLCAQRWCGRDCRLSADLCLHSGSCCYLCAL